MNHLVLFGAPFSGKGVQSKILAQDFSFVHISVGDILRSEIELQSLIGKMTKEFVLKGTMVPNKIIIEMVNKRIDLFAKDTKFIFDGIPRTMEQTIDFEQLIKRRETTRLTFILLNVSKNELLRRAKVRASMDKRTDDQNNFVIDNRLKLYEELTVPVINHYSKMALLNQVDGEQEVQKVNKDILAIIG